MLENFDALIRSGSRRPLWTSEATAQQVDLGRAQIEAMLPHRAPFLFVDRITGFDPANAQVRGTRMLEAADPVFAGHFPGHPVYPGVLQLETMGQFGLCLLHMLDQRSNAGARAVRVHHAVFLAEVGPAQQLEVVAARVQADEFTAVCSGQILRDGVICAFGIMEVYFVEN